MAGPNFIQGAIKRPGQLHRDLGVPLGERIPADKVAAAAHSPDMEIRRRARLAQTLTKIRMANRGSSDQGTS